MAMRAARGSGFSPSPPLASGGGEYLASDSSSAPSPRIGPLCSPPEGALGKEKVVASSLACRDVPSRLPSAAAPAGHWGAAG
eukprot:CAMPEP_0172615314 /NCGR_PEP_ID=MMETSP1068-20121228/57681_1 /TAXON_ID=35684 /ORGANISM="Pseudopedinella elastica, Strain CCMP716" /LENGTH=81 /DNA_ID=CAMNT_0013420413 /DNA_START=6 /DNA_END=247 /DNA_ORIENTATION=-